VKSLHNVPATAPSTGGRLLERLFELGVRLADSMDRGLAERGLTRARAELLWRLRREGPQTQRALSLLLECTPRNVTGLVDALESAGYVARGPHPTDRRATVVRLTRKGTVATGRMEAEYQATAATMFVDLDQVEIDALTAILDRILVKLARPANNEATTA